MDVVIVKNNLVLKNASDAKAEYSKAFDQIEGLLRAIKFKISTHKQKFEKDGSNNYLYIRDLKACLSSMEDAITKLS